METCSLEFCSRKVRAKGLCSAHYVRQREGKPLVPLRPSPQSIDQCAHAGCTQKKIRVAKHGYCAEHRGDARIPCPIYGCSAMLVSATVCVSHSVVLRRYNISVAQFNAFREQGCNICGVMELEGKKSFVVDHDHGCCSGTRSCGKCVRGVLCNTCNTRLGMLENRAWAQRAETYLARAPIPMLG